MDQLLFHETKQRSAQGESITLRVDVLTESGLEFRGAATVQRAESESPVLCVPKGLSFRAVRFIMEEVKRRRAAQESAPPKAQ